MHNSLLLVELVYAASKREGGDQPVDGKKSDIQKTRE
jgi:hypothetical protein